MSRNIVVLIALACVVSVPASGAPIQERKGYAYPAGDDRLLYTEEHREWLRDGEVVRSEVTYRDADGGVIATKRLDFSGVPTHPDFELNNHASGHIEGAEQQPDGVRVFFRRTDGHELKEKKVALPDEAIIDGGFDRFIELNWERLLSGEVFERPFLVPSFQRFVNFRIYLEKQRGDDVIFVMEPASFLVRLVGEGIVVTLGRSERAGVESMDAPEVEAAQEAVAEARSQAPAAVDDAGQPLLADTGPGEPSSPEPDAASVESTPPAEIQPAPETETPVTAASDSEVVAPEPAAEVPEEAPAATVSTPAEAVTETQTPQSRVLGDTSAADAAVVDPDTDAATVDPDADAASVAPDIVVGTSPESAQPLTVEAVPDRSGEAPAAPETQPGSTAVEAAPVTAADAPAASPARSPSQADSIAEAPSAPSTGVAAVEEAAQAPPSGPSMELEAVQPAAEAGVDAETAATRQPEAELQPTTAPRTVEATAPQTVKLQELQQRSGGAGVVAHYAGVLKGWLQRNMHYPRAARLAGQEGDVVVRFVIDREGNVQSVELETGSGYPLLDREATEMVERGDPFPAMPDDMPGDRLEVRVPVSFHVRDETLNKNLPPIDLE